MSDQSVIGRIGVFMARAFEGCHFNETDDIFDLGFGNSLFAMQLVAYVEREFGFEVESEDLEMRNFRSIRAIADLVARKTHLGGLRTMPQASSGLIQA